jgi:HAD superfamily hydrolase (TIGR01549 family)
MTTIRNESDWLPADGVSTVFFDLDGTLIFHKPDSFDVISAFCAEVGQPLSPAAERRGRRIRHEYFVDPDVREQLDGLSADQFWHHFNRRLLEALGVQGDLEDLAAEVSARFQALDLVYDCPEIGDHTLAELHRRGYDLGLITNRQNVEHFYELLDAMALRPHFDMILAAGEVGIIKPEPGIFDIGLERMGALAGQSIYVGDNYWADVVGAERAGITPVLLDPYYLFPEAECLVLEQIDDLLAWLPDRA